MILFTLVGISIEFQEKKTIVVHTVYEKNRLQCTREQLNTLFKCFRKIILYIPDQNFLLPSKMDWSEVETDTTDFK